ncbi:partial Aminopeptidase YwaD, partial [uncultured bacterium]
MRATIPVLLLSIITLCTPARSASAGGFSGARAYATLRTLAGEIGPRPMGSPAEQRALAFAESSFVAAGCDTAYVMRMTNAKGVNTTSGIAVGVLRGSGGRIIVIGGHIDSSAPDVPVANDDGSGAACVIELSRVLGARDLRSTIVFACFGGEEEGLQGSTWFVDHFPEIDSVDLMLQIDMADGASYFELDPDAAFQVSAPRWLPEAAQEIYNAQRNDGNLRYLTHMATLNSSTPGGTGSDHMPFLERGIPAIDFTSDIGYPIHSPLDNLAMFDSSGLERSGSLVLGLVERFDGGVPSRTTEKYYLLQYAGHLFFLSHEIMYVLSAIAVILSVMAFNTLRRRRLKDRAGEPSLSGLKLVFFAFILQIGVWLPETLLGALTGYRYPWVNNFPAFTLLALLGGLLVSWPVLRLATRWRIGTDPFPLFVRFFILMFGAWFGAFMANPEIALYMAWPLFWISLAVLIRPVWFKRVAALVALYLPARLVFVEPLTIFLRMLSGLSYENAFR